MQIRLSGLFRRQNFNPLNRAGAGIMMAQEKYIELLIEIARTQKEIISQLVFWCFDKSDSGEIAYASFDYHIKRK